MSISLKEYAEKLKGLEEKKEQFFADCANEVAARLLTAVRKRTPVSKGEFEPIRGEDGTYARYTKGPRKGKIKLKRLRSGGNLRRGWSLRNARKEGNTYVANVRCNVEYASYVEYGHRQNVGQFVPALGKRLVKPWVKGAHMLQISHDEISNRLPALLHRRVAAFLRRELHE